MRSGQTGTRRSGSRPGQSARPEVPATAEAVVRRGTQAVREQAAETAAEVSRRLREEGERLLSRQKRRAAGALQDVGASMHDAASRLHGGPLEGVAARMEVTAERVSRASRYLDEQDVDVLIRDAEEVVRRKPQWFLGGMFVIGLALARFVKATQSDGGRDAAPRDGNEAEVARQRRELARASRPRAERN